MPSLNCQTAKPLNQKSSSQNSVLNYIITNHRGNIPTSSHPLLLAFPGDRIAWTSWSAWTQWKYDQAWLVSRNRHQPASEANCTSDCEVRVYRQTAPKHSCCPCAHIDLLSELVVGDQSVTEESWPGLGFTVTARQWSISVKWFEEVNSGPSYASKVNCLTPAARPYYCHTLYFKRSNRRNADSIARIWKVLQPNDSPIIVKTRFKRLNRRNDSIVRWKVLQMQKIVHLV